MCDHIGHRRVVVWEPVDHVLTVTNVHERIEPAAARQPPEPGLLDRILVGPQVARRRVLRESLFAEGRRHLESVCPQGLALEIDRRVLEAFVARSGLRR